MKSIFVVDDSELHNILLRKMLHNCGYRVFTFTDGYELLENLKHTLPNLIISDIDMPRLNGFDLYMEIKKYPAAKNIPLIYVSSLKGQEIFERTKECGAIDFVRKPLDKDLFLKVVAQTL